MTTYDSGELFPETAPPVAGVVDMTAKLEAIRRANEARAEAGRLYDPNGTMPSEQKIEQGHAPYHTLDEEADDEDHIEELVAVDQSEVKAARDGHPSVQSRSVIPEDLIGEPDDVVYEWQQKRLRAHENAQAAGAVSLVGARRSRQRRP
jgi:hypothetical protein